MPLGMEVGLGAGHIVLDEDPDPAPLRKKGAQPSQFSAHVCCDQMAGWIKMPLGTMVGLGPGNIVLDVDPAPPPRGTAPQILAHLLWPNGWMDQDATCYKGRPRPRPHCVASGPSSPFQKGHSPCPQFRPMYIVAKRSPISATVEYLLPIFPLFQQKYFLLCQNPNTAFQGHRGSRVHCKSDNISETVKDRDVVLLIANRK